MWPNLLPLRVTLGEEKPEKELVGRVLTGSFIFITRREKVYTSGKKFFLCYNANEVKKLRVIAGQARGRKLKAPRGISTRPTLDRVREALFNIIGNRIWDSTCLDLFAGTGALAIEALSRGATRAVLVEKDPKALACIRDNLSSTGLEERAEVLKDDVYRAIPRLGREGRKFDFIFLDPPYEQGHLSRVLPLLSQYRLLQQEGWIIVETRSREPAIEEIAGYRLKRREKYGEAALNFYIEEEKAE